MRNMLVSVLIAIAITAIMSTSGCVIGDSLRQGVNKVPHKSDWGIYELDLATQNVRLVYSSPTEIFTSVMRLSNSGDTLVFVPKPVIMNEIHTINITGGTSQKLTEAKYFDAYPTWSPDDKRIAFVSKRNKDLDIYVMDADGENLQLLYDSGHHDMDIDWVGSHMVFTSDYKIWRINDDGTQPIQITDPPDSGQRGATYVPIGDYNPRLSPDGSTIVFDRLEDPNSRYGSSNIYAVGSDGSGEKRLTDNGYAQGMASWAYSGDKVVYAVAAIDDEPTYDIYIMNADGSDNRNITPDYFPDTFRCHSPIFSRDDSRVFFIGQWWEVKQ